MSPPRNEQPVRDTAQPTGSAQAMITTPTVFVVGAGASKPYGLPLGGELLKLARDPAGSPDIYRLLRTLPVSDEALDDFLGDLRCHPAQSIDAFLETRQHDEQKMLIGRAVIAVLMGLSVRSASGYETTQDWLEYLFGRMMAGCPTPIDFATSNRGLTFLTFNFDSVIETRLAGRIRAAYKGFKPHELDQGLQAIRVLHLHGLLPAPPAGPMSRGAETFETVVPEWTAWMQAAAKSINIVHDAVTGPAIDEGQRLLEKAQVVCFLGFGFHAANLERLDVRNTIKKAGQPKSVYGSALHLPMGEVEWVKGKFRSIELGHSTQDCLAMLREHHVFRD